MEGKDDLSAGISIRLEAFFRYLGKFIFVLVILFCFAELSLRLLYKGLHYFGRQREVSYRVVTYEGYNDKSQADCIGSPKLVMHSYLGYVPEPNYHCRCYTISPLGHFRAVDRISRDDFNIFFTGGLAAFGAYVYDKNCYTTILKKLLRRKFHKSSINVINAGVGGYNSVQERILIENIILNYNPKIIVMFTGWNDTYYGYLGTNIEEEETFMNFAKYHSRNLLTPPNYDNYAVKLDWLVDQVKYQLIVRKKITNKIATSHRPYGDVLNTFLKQIDIVSTLGRKYGFTLILALQPTIYSTSKLLSPEEQMIRSNSEKRYIGFPQYNKEMYKLYRSALPKFAKQRNLIYIDADQAIANYSRTLFRDHVHLSDVGNEILARFFAEKLSYVIQKKHSDTLQ